MNNKNTTDQEDIPKIINLEEYNNLLRELEFSGENLFSASETNIELELSKIVSETIRLISNIFYRMPIKNYLKHCILKNVIEDVDRLLRHHISYEKLFELLNKLNDEVWQK